jgi:hypothetical protein
MSALMQRIEAMNSRQEQFMAQVYQGMQSPPAPAQGGGQEGDDDANIDPATQRALARASQALDQKIAQVDERADFLAYQQHVTQMGFTPEAVQATEQTYEMWKRSGMTFAGKPPSRFDALRYTAGILAEQGKPVRAGAGGTGEHTVQAHNRHAVVERPGRTAPRGQAEAPDPQQLTRRERMKDGGKYWADRLDKSGGW